MKTIKYILSSILLISGIYACNDDWDSHYSQEEQVVNNVNITVVNKSAVDYLQSQPELSSMYQLFSETGVLDEMVEKNLIQHSCFTDRKSTRLNSSHRSLSRMPSSA